jgi:hypothetical protein
MAVFARRLPVASRAGAGVSYLEWSVIFAGAVGAAAISFLLLTFGASIGLSLTSPWPGAGVSVWATVIAVAWWTVLVEIGSFFVGGYLAGRMRTRWGATPRSEGEFRDGAHGFMVWAVGVLMFALVLAWTGGAILKMATQPASNVAAGAASSNANALQAGPVDYAVDILLRPAPRAANSGTAGEATTGTGALRNEASRIIAGSIKNGEFTARDRDYLTQVVQARNGSSQADAQQRVDQAINEAKDREIKTRAAADLARRTALIAGFLTAASLLISLAAACFGAGLGGRHRDEGTTAHLLGHRVW